VFGLVLAIYHFTDNLPSQDKKRQESFVKRNFRLGFTVLALLLLCRFDLSANSLYSLTGSYDIRAYDYVHVGESSGLITGPSNAIIPDITESLSDTLNGGVNVTAYARIFGGSATYDTIHCCYIEVENTISSLLTGDVSSIYVIANFTVTDTITPTSDSLPFGTPVQFRFRTWSEGSFDLFGSICQDTNILGVGGGEVRVAGPGGNADALGCPNGGNFTRTSYRDYTLYIGQPYTFTWTLQESAGSGIGIYTHGLSRGSILHGQHTDFNEIDPLTNGVEFTSASGALYRGPSAVPEPSALLLLATGCSCLALCFLRKTSNTSKGIH
jgi:hypothetical protein